MYFIRIHQFPHGGNDAVGIHAIFGQQQVVWPGLGKGVAQADSSHGGRSFLAQHLGGRKEPIGDDFEGSSLQVKEGKEGVPGVAEALQSKD